MPCYCYAMPCYCHQVLQRTCLDYSTCDSKARFGSGFVQMVVDYTEVLCGCVLRCAHARGAA